MENLSTTAVAKFLDICLVDVLDFLGLDELLLSAMPVSQCWREHTLAHPIYWRHIQLCKYYGLAQNRVLQSVDLFLLRLSRTRDRPIWLDITCDDLEVFVPHIIQHMSHVQSLYLDTSLSSAETLLDAFRLTQAPQLERMVLAFRFNNETTEAFTRDDIPQLPRDLFSSHAPQLKTLHLQNVVINPDSGSAPYLSLLTSLGFMIDPSFRRVPLERKRLLDISLYFPKLSALHTGGGAVLDDPVFWKASTWNRLDAASFTGNSWDGRSYLSLPVAGVHRLDLHCLFAFEIIDLPSTISGPIRLVIDSQVEPFPEEERTSGVGITFCMTTMGSVPYRERWVHTAIWREQDGLHPTAMIAFQQETFLERLERLEILLGNWDRLVSAGYLTRFPALRTIVLLVEAGPNGAARMPSASSVLACPRLTQLVLQETKPSVHARIEAADVAAFAAHAVGDARLPLRLELVGVTLDGAWEDFLHVFTDEVPS